MFVGFDSQNTSHSFPHYPNWNRWVWGISLFGFRGRHKGPNQHQSLDFLRPSYPPLPPHAKLASEKGGAVVLHTVGQLAWDRGRHNRFVTTSLFCWSNRELVSGNMIGTNLIITVFAKPHRFINTAELMS